MTRARALCSVISVAYSEAGSAPAYPLRQKRVRDVGAYSEAGSAPAYPLRQKWVRDVVTTSATHVI